MNLQSFRAAEAPKLAGASYYAQRVILGLSAGQDVYAMLQLRCGLHLGSLCFRNMFAGLGEELEM